MSESFFAVLKTELVYHERYEGHQDTLHSIFEYIEVFYNRQRRHSTLDYLCPAEYEKQKLILSVEKRERKLLGIETYPQHTMLQQPIEAGLAGLERYGIGLARLEHDIPQLGDQLPLPPNRSV